MKKREGAQLAEEAARSYARQAQQIAQAQAELAATVRPLLDKFYTQASLLAADLLTDAKQPEAEPDEAKARELSRSLPLLARWFSVLGAADAPLRERLEALSQKQAQLQALPAFARLERIADWVGIQREMSLFEAQPYFQKLFLAEGLGGGLPWYEKVGLFFLGLIGRSPRHRIPPALGFASLEACFKRYTELTSRFNSPDARPPEQDQADSALLSHAQAYADLRPQLQRLSEFYGPQARLARYQRLLAVGALTAVLNPDGQAFATAAPDWQGMALALIQTPEAKLKDELEKFIALLLSETESSFDLAAYHALKTRLSLAQSSAHSFSPNFSQKVSSDRAWGI